MGKVLDFGYRSLHSQKFADKASQKPAGARVSAVTEKSESAPKPTVARAAVKARKAAAGASVINPSVILRA
jgi:hypothetical protein